MRVVAASFVALALLVARAPEARAIAPDIVPVESPAPDAPLKEIGRIRVTTSLCRALVSAAAEAVAIEAENDRRLAIAETTLQTIDLDRNELSKYTGVREITKQYLALRDAALSGNHRMREFREQAKTASTLEQRDRFITFANALDGALRRQRLLADDIGTLVAYLDAHDPLPPDQHEKLVFNALLAQNDVRLSTQPFDARVVGPFASTSDSLSMTARKAGRAIAQRAEAIGSDEETAAARIEPAFERC